MVAFVPEAVPFRHGRTSTASVSSVGWSDDADIVRASQLQHAVEDMDRHADFAFRKWGGQGCQRKYVITDAAAICVVDSDVQIRLVIGSHVGVRKLGPISASDSRYQAETFRQARNAG
jgi:hypothetical protein